MTADERIEAAAKRLEKMIMHCPNCGGSNKIGVLCITGVRLEECHVCKPLRRLLALLAE